jgi:hypothetical protein
MEKNKKFIDEKMRSLVEEIEKLEGVDVISASEDEDFTQIHFTVEDWDALLSVGNRLAWALQYLFNTAPSKIGNFVGAIEYHPSFPRDDEPSGVYTHFSLLCEITNKKWRYHCISVFRRELKKMRLKYGTKKGNIQLGPVPES